MIVLASLCRGVRAPPRQRRGYNSAKMLQDLECWAVFFALVQDGDTANLWLLF